jgi:hypothetical protein
VPVDVGPQNYWAWYAENEVATTYGQRVSVQRKGKQLNKFGRTINADNGVKTTVAEFQGTVVNETYVSTNIIDTIGSDSASDTEKITLEGHTIDSSGNLTFVVQNATLTGITPVPLATPLARATRAYVCKGTFAAPASALVGNVYVYDNTDGHTLGVPDTAAATKLMITAGNNQSYKVATAISQFDYWFLTSIDVGIQRGSGASAHADIDLEFREIGGVWRPMGIEMDVASNATTWSHHEVAPYLIVPPNTDVRGTVTADTNDTRVDMRITGLLAKITPPS